MIPTIFMFIVVTVGVFAVYQLLTQYLYPDHLRVRDRLDKEFATDPKSKAASPLFQSLENIQLPVPAEAVPDSDQERRLNLRLHCRSVLKQVGVPLTPTQLVLASLLLGLVFGLAVQWFAGIWWGAAAGLAASTAPFMVIYRRMIARRDKLLRQLPAAFELMARVLRAGSSVPQALQAVIDGFENPLREEFHRCQKHLELGLSPELTYQDLAQRSGIVEIRLFVMAMTIQRQTGGNLSDVLERLAGLLRARLRLRQQVLVWTAEGRLQGLVLTALPFCIFGVMSFINADYVKELLEHTWLIGGTLLLMMVGTLWIRRIVQLDY